LIAESETTILLYCHRCTVCVVEFLTNLWVVGVDLHGARGDGYMSALRKSGLEKQRFASLVFFFFFSVDLLLQTI
jgi:hypothetical protein